MSNLSMSSAEKLLRELGEIESIKDPAYAGFSNAARNAIAAIQSLQSKLTQAKELMARVVEWEPHFPVEASLLDDMAAFVKGAKLTHEPLVPPPEPASDEIVEWAVQYINWQNGDDCDSSVLQRNGGGRGVDGLLEAAVVLRDKLRASCDKPQFFTNEGGEIDFGPVAAEPILKGTYNCPVCGAGFPHTHDASDIDEKKHPKFVAEYGMMFLDFPDGKFRSVTAVDLVTEVNRLTARVRELESTPQPPNVPQVCTHPWCWIVFSEDGNPACSSCKTNLLGPTLPPKLGPVAPIANVIIDERGNFAGISMYNPGLPPGAHDLFPVPLDPNGKREQFLQPSQPPEVVMTAEDVVIEFKRRAAISPLGDCFISGPLKGTSVHNVLMYAARKVEGMLEARITIPTKEGER